jgi:beta-lactamase class A
MLRTVLLLTFPNLVCAGAEPVGALLETKLLDRIRAVEAGTDGVVGVAAIDLSTGQPFAYRGDVVFPQASSIKIPIMMQVFEQAAAGRIKLDELVRIDPKEAVQGSGHLRLMLRERAMNATVLELVTAMIETSDNTATNKLISLVGMDRVNAMLDRLGFRQTRLRRVMLDAAAAERNDENVSTPLEMARLAELLYRGKLDGSNRMIEILKLVRADFRSAVPAAIAVAAKPGELTGVRCETGIVYAKNRPFALSVASTFLTEPQNPVPAIAALVYGHFEKLGRSNQYGNGGVR